MMPIWVSVLPGVLISTGVAGTEGEPAEKRKVKVEEAAEEALPLPLWTRMAHRCVLPLRETAAALRAKIAFAQRGPKSGAMLFFPPRLFRWSIWRSNPFAVF